MTDNVIGQDAHDAPVSANPVLMGAEARNSNTTPVSAAGDVTRLAATLAGAQIVMPYSVPEAIWHTTGVKTDLTDLVVAVARSAGIRNYVTGAQFQNTSAVATEVVLKDGAGIIHRVNCPASMAMPIVIAFAMPLRGNAAVALNAACLTTGANVIMNVQGFFAP